MGWRKGRTGKEKQAEALSLQPRRFVNVLLYAHTKVEKLDLTLYIHDHLHLLHFNMYVYYLAPLLAFHSYCNHNLCFQRERDVQHVPHPLS